MDACGVDIQSFHTACIRGYSSVEKKLMYLKIKKKHGDEFFFVCLSWMHGVDLPTRRKNRATFAKGPLSYFVSVPRSELV